MNNTVILTHAGADFDAISSAFAASKLYPGSFVIHPGSTDINAQKILGIFGDVLNFKKVRELPKEFTKEIKRVVVVDTKFKNRVGDGKEFLSIENAQKVVIDHHPGTTDIPNAICINKQVGANTTILVNLLRLKKVNLSPIEATILALGIYEDTGSLSFPQVTNEDFKALEFLFSFGVDMKLIHRFTSPFLQEEQIGLLKTFLDNLKEYNIDGHKIGITHASLNKYIAGIAILAHKILEMIDLDVVFTIVSLENTVHVVGRSVSEAFNLTQVAEAFNGGGHPTAISFVVKNGDIKDVQEKILKELMQTNFYTIKAKDIMSSPVKTISKEATVKEALEIMIKLGFSGLPIEENGNIVGIIEKKNVEKAFLMDKKNSPVKQFYTPRIVTVPFDASLREIENTMVDEDVGRVLVEQNGKIVGIISRSDLLKAYRLEDLVREIPKKDVSIQLPDKKFISIALKKAVDPHILKILKEFGRIANNLGLEIYLVGGAVRDALLGKKIVDFDFVLDDAIKFGEYLKSHFSGVVQIFPETQTVHFEFSGINFDFVTARREFYLDNSLVPIVEKATLKEDLSRRDFTINAMAISLKESDFGTLFDFFSGYEDLLKGTIRVIKPLSFVEDPSRILRAIKYMVELDFKLSNETEFLLKKAVEIGAIRSSSSQRVQEELRELLTKDEIDVVLHLLTKYNITKELFRIDRIPKTKIHALKRFYKSYKDPNIRLQGLIFLLYLNKKLDNAYDFSKVFGIKKRILLNIIEAKRVLSTLSKDIKKEDEANIAIKLNKIDEIFIKAFYFVSNREVKSFIEKYLNYFRKIKIEIKGDDLLKLGLKEGAQFRTIFETLTKLKIKGIIKNKDDEINYILSHRGEFEWK